MLYVILNHSKAAVAEWTRALTLNLRSPPWVRTSLSAQPCSDSGRSGGFALRPILPNDWPDKSEIFWKLERVL